jgi:hypothetical protein
MLARRANRAAQAEAPTAAAGVGDGSLPENLLNQVNPRGRRADPPLRVRARAQAPPHNGIANPVATFWTAALMLER